MKNAHCRRHAFRGACADVADREDAQARALEQERTAVRPVPVPGEVGVAPRLLARDHEALVVLAHELDQPLRPRGGADHGEHGAGLDSVIGSAT